MILGFPSNMCRLPAAPAGVLQLSDKAKFWYSVAKGMALRALSCDKYEVCRDDHLPALIMAAARLVLMFCIETRCSEFRCFAFCSVCRCCCLVSCVVLFQKMRSDQFHTKKKHHLFTGMSFFHPIILSGKHTAIMYKRGCSFRRYFLLSLALPLSMVVRREFLCLLCTNLGIRCVIGSNDLGI